MGCSPHVGLQGSNPRKITPGRRRVQQPDVGYLDTTFDDSCSDGMAGESCDQASGVTGGSAPGGWSLLPAKGSEVAVAYQLMTLFVPETEGERFEAGEQRDGRHSLK